MALVVTMLVAGVLGIAWEQARARGWRVANNRLLSSRAVTLLQAAVGWIGFVWFVGAWAAIVVLVLLTTAGIGTTLPIVGAIAAVVVVGWIGYRVLRADDD